MQKKLIFTNAEIWADSGKVKYLDAVAPVTGDRKYERIPIIIPPHIVIEVPEELANDMLSRGKDHLRPAFEPTDVQILLWEQSGKRNYPPPCQDGSGVIHPIHGSRGT